MFQTSVASVVILAAVHAAPIEGRFPEAVPIFRCGYETETDSDFDGWPDGFARQRGPGYPHYIDIRIQETSGGEGRRALRVACDGGAAAVFGPAVPVGPRFAYVFEGCVRTADLVNDKARLVLVFLDGNRRPIETHRSTPLGGTNDWTKLRIGPISPRSSEVRYAMVSGQVDAGPTADLGGEVWFDDFWLARTPRLVVAADAPHGIYTRVDDVAIEGELSGLESQDFTVRCELLDVDGRRLESLEQPLKLEKIAAVVVEGEVQGDAVEVNAVSGDEFLGRFAWRPKVPAVGFYRVHVAADGRQGSLHREEIPLLVIPDDESTAGLEFGWSLPQGEGPIPLLELPKLLVRYGVQRLKFPVWFAEDDGQRATELVNLAERLSNRQIEFVGLLNNPPPAVREKFKSDAELLAIDVFGRSPELWYPALEPVLARLSMNIRHWQLGADGDTSLSAASNLASRVQDVKRQFEKIGQNLYVGFGWDWQYEVPSAAASPGQSPARGKNPWRFLSLSARPALTAEELGANLATLGRKHGERWVSIRPLPAAHYSLAARVDDLVGQMVAAKTQGAEGIFCDDPFDDDRGLLDAEGRPTELLVAWRTAATLLGGTSYVGSMDLPSGRTCAVFARDEKALVYVAAGQRGHETLAWGTDAVQVNPWGQVAALQESREEQTVVTGPLPCFVDGVDLAQASWRTGVKIVPPRIPSLLGQPQQLRLVLRNTFGQDVAGTAQVMGPESWRLDALPIDFELPADERIELPVEINLPHDATLGQHLLRIDFEINGDRAYRVTAYPRIEVGGADLALEVDTRLNERGQLEVEQRLINATDKELTFKCFLLAPERRRLRRQVVEHRRGVDVQTYILEDGAQLVGQKMLLRAEEVGGLRTLNLNFTAEP